MIGRMVLLSVFALIFLLALGLNRYLNRTLAKRRVARWLTRALFIAVIPALLAPATVIAINPAAPYLARDELMLYVHLFYAGAGAALVCVVALAAAAGVIAIQRGDVRGFLKGSVGFVQRFANALKYANEVWVNRRVARSKSSYSYKTGEPYRLYLAKSAPSHDRESPEQGSSYDPLEKWMDPAHPAHPLLHEIFDD